MALIRYELLSAFDALAPHCEVSAPLCEVAASGALDVPVNLHAICTRIGIAEARAGHIERALVAGGPTGLFEKTTPTKWRVSDRSFAGELAPLLRGALLYRSRVHQDDNVVDVVLTKPPAPSQVTLQLESMLSGTWGFRDTKELLPAIADSAKASLVVMTPFLDEVGADIVLNLFENTAAADKCLVLRTTRTGELPEGLLRVQAALARRDVQVLNFKLDRLGATGTETFHAKVVLADDNAAYVGSSNMNQWSFQYSLELGLFVQGKAASRVAGVMGAVRAVAQRLVTE